LNKQLYFFSTTLFCLLVAGDVFAQIPSYVPADNLLAWYGFNGNTNDASANGFHGNAVSLTSAVDRTGNVGGAFFFNGAESEIVVPFNEVLNAFPFSVSLWCKLEADDNGSMLIQRYTNSSWSGWVMSVSNTESTTQTVSPGYMVQSPPNCNGVVSSPQCDTGINYSGDIYDHLWHMLTFTVDGDSGRFYVDGTLQTTQGWTGPSGAPEGDSDLRIGGTDMGSSFYFHGGLDDIGLWNRALTPEEVSVLYNVLPPIAGCTNTNACNYAPDAIVNDGSCVFDCAGCIDPCACNYNQNAAINDGSCDYSCNTSMTFITVFHDANENGSFDGGENPLQYWPVQIVELQKTVYTDEAGMILVPLPVGVVHYQLVNIASDWAPTTPSLVELMVPGNTQAFFGLNHITGESSAESEEIPGYYPYMHCEHGLESGVYVRNTGGQTLHGSLTLTCDPQFTPLMPWSLSTPPNISGPGFAQWNIQGLEPWETRLLAFHIAGPGSEWDGLATNYMLELELRDALETVVYANTFSALKEIQCEEQPARLQSDPIGVDDAFHYVPQGTSITFRSQFQNHTSDWAEDVLVIQNLNSQQFDISSFELLYASESIVGCLHDDGTIDLQFSDLVVAPTDADASQSGGYAVYRARLRDDIIPDSTFYHNMHVVYDLDNPGGSDMVYHTIYDCSRLAHVVGDEIFCEGDTVLLESNGAWIDEYRWLLGDTLLSTEPMLNVAFDPGFYNVVCQFRNPVCYVCEHKPIHIMEAPQGSVVVENDQLISTDSYSFQWYWGGEPIEGATQNSVTVNNDGIYQVQWTSLEGCTATSEQYVINSVMEHSTVLNVFPNPAVNEARVMLPPGLYDLSIYDTSGRNLVSQKNFNTLKPIDVTGFPKGVYMVVVSQPGGDYRGLLTIQ
jgi:hypothetical protein